MPFVFVEPQRSVCILLFTLEMRNSQTLSYWMATSSKTYFPKLSEDLAADVAVIGAGIAGLTAAILLKQQGKKVIVIDQFRVAGGESGRTTAHLTEILDTGYRQLMSDFGKKNARLAAKSSRAAINQIEAFINEFQISCDFQRVPAYLYAEHEKHLSKLKKEFRAFQEVDLQSKWEEHVPLPFPTFGGIRVENQAQFHPGKYLSSLAQSFCGDGCFVFENTKAIAVEDGEPCRVVTEHGVLTVNEVIVATNSPISNKFFLPTHVAAYRTYALAAKLKGSSPPLGLYWDLDDPYHYTRCEGDVWIIGGEDHKTGLKEDTEDSFRQLEHYSRSHYGVDRVLYEWSGQVMEPVDGLPYIGRDLLSKNIFVATGFSGNGMTLGTLSGMLIADLIVKKKNPYSELYKVSRVKPLAAAREFISENKDFPLCFLKDRMQISEEGTLSEINPGEGKTLKIDKEPVAAYRDEAGVVHAVSAICTHMGCYVHWNQGEKSWDCPCHGSRFNTDGKMLNGPATQDLKKKEVSEVNQQQSEQFKRQVPVARLSRSGGTR